MTSPDGSRPRWARRFLYVLLAFLALAFVAERIAALWFKEQAEQRLVRELEAAFDLDLDSGGIEWSLLLGKLALKDVELRPRSGRRHDLEEPLLRARRIAIDIEWSGVFDRDVVLALEVDGLRVLATRDREGHSNWSALNPESRGSDEGMAQPERDTASSVGNEQDGEAWTFTIDSLTARDAQLFFVLDAIPEFAPLHFKLPELSLRGERWRFGALHNTTRGKVRVDAGAGPLDLAFDVERSPEGWRIDIDLVGRDLDVGPRALAIGALGRLTGSAGVDLNLHYALRPGGHATLTGDARLHRARFRATSPPHSAEIESVVLKDLLVDFDGLRVVAGAAEFADGTLQIAPLRPGDLDTAGSPPSSESTPWDWRVGNLSAQRVAVEILRPDGSGVALGQIERLTGHDLGSHADARGAFELALVGPRGGSMSASGRLSGRPHSVTADASWQAVAAEAVLAGVAWPDPTEIESGTTSGSLSLEAGRTADASGLARVAMKGSFRFDDIRLMSRVARGSHRLELRQLAVEDAELRWPVEVAPPTLDGVAEPSEFGPAEASEPPARAEPNQQVAIRLGSVRVVEPSLEVWWTRPPESGPEPDLPPPELETPGPVDVRIDEVTLEDGRLRLTNSSFEPTLKLGLDRVAASMSQSRWPQGAIDAFRLDATALGRGSLSLSGHREPGSGRLVVNAKRSAAALLSPLARETIGYQITHGRFTLDSEIDFVGDYLDSRNRLVLHDVRVQATSANRPIDSAIGMPLGAALVLLRDLDGDVVLDIAVAADRDEVRVAFAEALRSVFLANLPGMAASPLKLAEGVGLGVSNALALVGRIAGVERIPVVSGVLAAAGLEPEDATRVAASYELEVTPDGTRLDLPAWAAVEEIGHELVARPMLELLLIPSPLADAELAAALADFLTTEFLLDPQRVSISVARRVESTTSHARSMYAIVWRPERSRAADQDGGVFRRIPAPPSKLRGRLPRSSR